MSSSSDKPTFTASNDPPCPHSPSASSHSQLQPEIQLHNASFTPSSLDHTTYDESFELEHTQSQHPHSPILHRRNRNFEQPQPASSHEGALLKIDAIDIAVQNESAGISKTLLGQSSEDAKCDVLLRKYLKLFRYSLEKEAECDRLQRLLENRIYNTVSDDDNDGDIPLSSEKSYCERLQSSLDHASHDSRALNMDLPDDTLDNMDSNAILKERFKDMLDQYELRERHFLSMAKSKDIKYHLSQAKCEKYRQKFEQEKPKRIALKKTISSFAHTETELRSQLDIYIDKFRQVEATLSQSNELIHTFRCEIDQMGKKTKKLEKENASIRMKYESMNKAIMGLAEERKQSHQEVQTLISSKAKLESLCRALQEERKRLLKASKQ
ncbi:hypothetical protein BASA50_010435 [Batrachochytrium salamandrivorans]|uniref:Transforming acidic coiled-coil-containing protein C-terminal domain-containing protein n=1 Tax=Batrachochytrium salamandrivorans TaxID=1357716 RepID=A0ABQ8EYJ0_9FUNG|nr:hypothetical protein BASA60_010110 [Batrachochytrium salamandrivorans]KAH6573851.1 hypothetical protein BASA62_002720 [Batrachochytrium salamandrivorans]KAH6588866.1 hypothetical protein BASA50_010435 [Batrachochytrium salamandrivorans]KAH6601960.1 hypothetical protein BASA61_001602 [Batrachochytrium salamandrivorans]KAH9264091.1 hypothetical protein BASA83_012448 [Batrachochytrium salamandrivorans]